MDDTRMIDELPAPSLLATRIVDALWGVFYKKGLVAAQQVRDAERLVDRYIALDAQERELETQRSAEF